MWHNMRNKQLIERKRERKRLFHRHRHEWKEDIEMYLRDVRLNAVCWSYLALRLAPAKGFCVHGNGSSASIKH